METISNKLTTQDEVDEWFDKKHQLLVEESRIFNLALITGSIKL